MEFNQKENRRFREGCSAHKEPMTAAMLLAFFLCLRIFAVVDENVRQCISLISCVISQMKQEGGFTYKKDGRSCLITRTVYCIADVIASVMVFALCDFITANPDRGKVTSKPMEPKLNS